MLLLLFGVRFTKGKCRINQIYLVEKKEGERLIEVEVVKLTVTLLLS